MNINRKSWFYRLQKFTIDGAEPENFFEYILNIMRAIILIICLPIMALVTGFVVGSGFVKIVTEIISNIVIFGIVFGGCGFFVFFCLFFVYLRGCIKNKQFWFCKKINYFN